MSPHTEQPTMVRQTSSGSQSPGASDTEHCPFLRFRTSSEAILEQLNAAPQRREIHQIPTDSDEVLKSALFVGHINTDLDSVGGAIGAAALFGGIPTIAEPVETLNGEIKFALAASGLEAPQHFSKVDGYKNKKICLVDHTEQKQMVPEIVSEGLLHKNVVGVIDHHALASSFSTESPIYMEIKPWGSMSTIVTNLFIQKNQDIPLPIAKILLSAILSDTLNLKSPTTTEHDKFCACLLGLRCGIKTREEMSAYALDMFRAKTEWICSLGPKKMCRADCKAFEVASTTHFGIAVLEIAGSPDPVLSVASEIAQELKVIKLEKGFAYCFLCVVDVLSGTSQVIVSSEAEARITRQAFEMPSSTKKASGGETSPASTSKTSVGGEESESEEGVLGGAITLSIGEFASRKKQFMPRYTKTLKNLLGEA